MDLSVAAFEFPLALEIIATFAWATSGAIVARTRRFDFMGVLFIAVITSTGGGLIRDGIFLQQTPVMVSYPLYLVIPLLCALFIILFGNVFDDLAWWPLVVNSIDASARRPSPFWASNCPLWPASRRWTPPATSGSTKCFPRHPTYRAGRNGRGEDADPPTNPTHGCEARDQLRAISVINDHKRGCAH